MTGRDPAAPKPACCWLSSAIPVALNGNIRWLPLTQILSRLHPVRSRRREPVLPARRVPLRARVADPDRNLGFGRWGEVFGDPTVASAMIDRIMHHADVINLKGASYRLKNHQPAADTA